MLDTILPTLATKADLADLKASMTDMKSSIIMWVVLVTLSVAALNVAVMAFMLHRALPVAQPAPAPQVIIVPQQPATPQK